MEKIVPAKSIHRSSEPPELQIHAAATFVQHGDPTSLDIEKRRDKVGELCQYCVPIEAKFVGSLKRHHIERAFESLKHEIIGALRRAGALRGGE